MFLLNIPKLKTFICNLSLNKVFSDPLNCTSKIVDLKLGLNRENFIVGANMLMSRDVVDFIIKNKDILDYKNYGDKDDLAISRLINNKYIEKKIG